MKNKFFYSVVIPIFNEDENLGELYNRLTPVMEKLNNNYEVIFVDDGSTDKSLSILKELHRKDDRIKIVSFMRNFGHHIAVTAGLDYVKGDAIILMDGDLQDPPEEIPKLCSKFEEGYDIVYAIRKTREDVFIKKITSKLFYTIFRRFTKIDIPVNIGIFRIVSRGVIDNLRKCREKSRFIVALMGWFGFSHVGVETKRDERYRGKTKYSFAKQIQLAIDGILSFNYFTLRVTTYFGFIVSICSFILGITMIIKKIFFGMPVSGYASIIVSIFFLGGIQLFMIGVMSEYIGRIYLEIQNRPVYIIKEFIER